MKKSIFYTVSLELKNGALDLESFWSYKEASQYANSTLAMIDTILEDKGIKKENLMFVSIFQDEWGTEKSKRITKLAVNKYEDDESYYNFKIALNSPYKWGPGYGEASDDEIRSNENALDALERFLEFRKVEKVDFRDVYNPMDQMEEIFIHPMELTGVAKISTLRKIVEFINNSNFKYTKIDYSFSNNSEGFKLFGAKMTYTYEEIFERLKTITDDEIKILKARHGSLAMNQDLKCIGLNFKSTTFANTRINRTVENQKDFVIAYLNERIAKL